jgi:hypothetical protein
MEMYSQMYQSIGAFVSYVRDNLLEAMSSANVDIDSALTQLYEAMKIQGVTDEMLAGVPEKMQEMGISPATFDEGSIEQMIPILVGVYG